MLKKKKIDVIVVTGLQESSYPIADTLESTPGVVLDTPDESVSLLNLIEADRDYGDIIPNEGEWYKVPEKAQVPVKVWLKEKIPTEVLIDVRHVLGKISKEVRTEACAFVMRDDATGKFFVVCPEYQDLTGSHYTVEIPAVKRMFMHYPNAVIVGEFHSHPFGVSSGMFSPEDHSSTEKMNGRYYGNITFNKDSDEFGGVNVRIAGVRKFLNPAEAFTDGVPSMTWRLGKTAEEALDKLTLEHIETVIERHSKSPAEKVDASVASLYSTGKTRGAWHQRFARHQAVATGGFTQHTPVVNTTGTYAEPISGVDGRMFYRNDDTTVDCNFIPNSIDVMELRATLEAEMGLSKFGSAEVDTLTAVKKIINVSGTMILVHLYTTGTKLVMEGDIAPVGAELVEQEKLEDATDITLYINVQTSKFSAITTERYDESWKDECTRLDSSVLFTDDNGGSSAFLDQDGMTDTGDELFHPGYTHAAHYPHTPRVASWDRPGVSTWNRPKYDPAVDYPEIGVYTEDVWHDTWPPVEDSIGAIDESGIDVEAIDEHVGELLEIAEAHKTIVSSDIHTSVPPIESVVEGLMEVVIEYVDDFISQLMPEPTAELKFDPLPLATVKSIMAYYKGGQFTRIELISATALDMLMVEEIAKLMNGENLTADTMPAIMVGDLISVYETLLSEYNLLEIYVSEEVAPGSVYNFNSIIARASLLFADELVQKKLKVLSYPRTLTGLILEMDISIPDITEDLSIIAAKEPVASAQARNSLVKLLEPLTQQAMSKSVEELSLSGEANLAKIATVLALQAGACRVLDVFRGKPPDHAQFKPWLTAFEELYNR